MTKKKEGIVLAHLKSFLTEHPDATYDDGWNAVYGAGAITGKTYTTKSERVAFDSTPEAREIDSIIGSLPRSRSESPAAKFVLRLPTSLYEKLKDEAALEGVSVNTLCVAKLAASLSSQIK